MASGDTLQVRVVGRYQDQNIVNTLHYLINTQDVPEEDVCQNLAQLWDNDLTDKWVARHLDTYMLVGLKCFQVDGASKVPSFVSINTAGDVVGEEVAAAVCRTITLYTGSTNSRRRGRVMLSGSAVAQFNTGDGAVTTAEQTLLTGLGTDLVTPLVVGESSFSLCIPPTSTLDAEVVINAVGRVTPSLIKSRRVKQFLIG